MRKTNSILLLTACLLTLFRGVRSDIYEIDDTFIGGTITVMGSQPRTSYPPIHLKDNDFLTVADVRGGIGDYFRIDMTASQQVSFIWLFGDHTDGHSFNVAVYLGNESADTTAGEEHIEDNNTPCTTQYGDGIANNCSGDGQYIHLVLKTFGPKLGF